MKHVIPLLLRHFSVDEKAGIVELDDLLR